MLRCGESKYHDSLAYSASSVVSLSLSLSVIANENEIHLICIPAADIAHDHTKVLLRKVEQQRCQWIVCNDFSQSQPSQQLALHVLFAHTPGSNLRP
jgi:hypothetical protein